MKLTSEINIGSKTLKITVEAYSYMQASKKISEELNRQLYNIFMVYDDVYYRLLKELINLYSKVIEKSIYSANIKNNNIMRKKVFIEACCTVNEMKQVYNELINISVLSKNNNTTNNDIESIIRFANNICEDAKQFPESRKSKFRTVTDSDIHNKCDPTVLTFVIV